MEAKKTTYMFTITCQEKATPEGTTTWVDTLVENWKQEDNARKYFNQYVAASLMSVNPVRVILRQNGKTIAKLEIFKPY